MTVLTGTSLTPCRNVLRNWAEHNLPGQYLLALLFAACAFVEELAMKSVVSWGRFLIIFVQALLNEPEKFLSSE